MATTPSDFQIAGTPSGKDDAQTAVDLIREGSADFLMKGILETSDLLRPVVKKENGLRTGRTMSHLAVFGDVPAYHKLLAMTDGGMLPYPDLDRKKEILINAVQAFGRLGYECPKAAVLCCKETYDEKMPEVVDAAALKAAAQRGEFGQCFVEGPVSYDIALDAEIARMKHFDCPHAGNFDILIVPDIHAGNILGKCFTVTCRATMAGIIVGSRVPSFSRRVQAPRVKNSSLWRLRPQSPADER
jgi:phosphate butyryltransferase